MSCKFVSILFKKENIILITPILLLFLKNKLIDSLFLLLSPDFLYKYFDS
jgi:hypothetical protein